MNNIYTFSGNIHLPDPNCPIYWMGSSKKDLMALPLEVRKFFGHALDFAQRGEQHDAAKILKGFGGAGVLEIVKEDRTSSYRAVYAVKFEHAVFVLHCFNKKSKRGIETPKADMDLIRLRLKEAQSKAKEME
jgi:phage-related protein